MARLDMIQGCSNNDVPRANFIVVPGIAGACLDDRTCRHFRAWLDRLVVDYKNQAQSWVYNHHLEIDKLESWDMYATTGDDLLVQLVLLQRDNRLGKNDNLVLIGHKMGCYILKKALAEAHQKDHKPEERELLDKIDTIVMVGEPNLQTDNQWEWFDLICVSIERPLPQKLANDLSVGVLQRIADSFEEVLLWSTLFEVTGIPRAKPKHHWNFRRTEPGGCICSVSIHVRKNTTADEEKLLEKGQGDDKICSFHPRSAHFQNLLMLNGPPALVQISDKPTFPINTECVATDHSLSIQPNKFQDQVATEKNYGPRTREEQCSPSKDINNSDEVASRKSCHEVGNSDTTKEHRFFMDTFSTFGTSTAKQTDISVLESFQDPRPLQNRRKRRMRTPALSSSIPPRDMLFFGRESILSLLKEAILAAFPNSEKNRVLQRQPRILYLTGSPGIGKTAIAVEYFYRSMDHIDHLFWLNASSQASLGKYCHDFAVALSLVEGRLSQDHEASRAKFLDWLETCGKTFLLVFDDVSRDSDLTPYIPKCGSGSILVTSRHKTCKGLDQDSTQIVEVPALEETEAARFLYHALFLGNRPDQSRDLCVAASRYRASPLILRHLANWSFRHRISIHYINNIIDIKEASLRLQVRLHHASINDIISIKVDAMDTVEFSVFNVLCLFDPEGVQDKLLFGAERSDCLPLQLFPRNSQALSSIMQQLWKSSLIENRYDKLWYVQQTVQDAVKSNMDYETFNDSFQTACLLVKAQWPPKHRLRNIINGFWPEFDALHSQVYSLAHSLVETRNTLVDPDDDFKQLLINHTWYNYSRGNQAEDRDLVHLAYSLYSTSNEMKARNVSSSCLPRWCLYVGLETNSINPRLVDTDRRHGSYMTLSYTWESADHCSPWKLTKDTINSYKRAIDFEGLPVVFRDAITITRNLGISYLWIDSLCVLHDSPEDIAEEFSHMADYYANCEAIIAEGGGSNSLPLLTVEKVAIVDVAQYSIYRLPRMLEKQHKWCSRGWVYQEQVLSPKFLLLDPNYLQQRDESPKNSSTVTTAERADSDVVKVISSGLEVPSRLPSDSQFSMIDEAQRTLENGRELMLRGSYVEATAILVLSRDLLAPLLAKYKNASNVYALATSLLGTAYHMLNLSSLALDILQAGNRLFTRLIIGRESQSHGMGRILFSMGTCLLELGKIEQCQETLKAAREQLLESDGTLNEWSASINIKLADCKLFVGDFGGAHLLLQSAMEYFQTESSESKQRQLARILHRQSIVYEAENNSIMYSAFTAAARDALIQITKSYGSTNIAATPTLTLSQQMFDELVDPWFR